MVANLSNAPANRCSFDATGDGTIHTRLRLTVGMKRQTVVMERQTVVLDRHTVVLTRLTVVLARQIVVLG